MLTYEEITKSEAIKTYIIRADETLGALGYTEHSFAHVMHVAQKAGYILQTMGYDERTVELAKIAGYLHDIGNHDEGTGVPVNAVAAALILADKAAERLGLLFKLIINEQQLI